MALRSVARVQARQDRIPERFHRLYLTVNTYIHGYKKLCMEKKLLAVLVSWIHTLMVWVGNYMMQCSLALVND